MEKINISTLIPENLYLILIKPKDEMWDEDPIGEGLIKIDDHFNDNVGDGLFIKGSIKHWFFIDNCTNIINGSLDQHTFMGVNGKDYLTHTFDELDENTQNSLNLFQGDYHSKIEFYPFNEMNCEWIESRANMN